MVLVFMAVSAVAVFAFVSLEAAPVEAAPVQAEVAPQVVEPAIQIERASYSEYSGGCPYSHSQMQLTEAPAEKLEDAPLAQVDLN
jgi:hypothetical protein